MVVISGSWAKNVATYPIPNTNNDMLINSNNNENKVMAAAKAVFICRANSHPFQERTLILDQPVKVGRSVARTRASVNNAIFDCKVLSRHHALIWYESGKFYLQDTKSSNGTFINNNRLSDENEQHEICSGDIVQFGVDVVENNRKVTHGCIIATLKLYLPDGKEAKASPSTCNINNSNNNNYIDVNNRYGYIPLDELYKLHQIIQEATQREQCLEMKLTTLQNVVDEAKKLANESWQAYVGEERLLSRVSELELQLQKQQLYKNWNDEKLKEEYHKLQDDNVLYQIAAKEALEKLHAQRLTAVAQATEQERLRITTEQELLLVKEQLVQAQLELEEVAQKLTEDQKKSDEKRINLEEQHRDLQEKFNNESEKVNELQMKLEEIRNANLPPSSVDNHIIYNDDVKLKEEMLAENECEIKNNNDVNVEPEQNHINLTVAPVVETVENGETEKSVNEIKQENNSKLTNESEIIETEFDESCPKINDTTDNEEYEKGDFDTDHIDSKTIKYKYQTAQSEYKKIEILEQIHHTNKLRIIELEKYLNDEKELNVQQIEENELLKDELKILKDKWKEMCNESEQLKDKIKQLKLDFNNKQLLINDNNSSMSSNSISYEQLVNIEEELVLLKEKYAQVIDDKLKLQQDLNKLKEQYNRIRNNSYNMIYIYVAPLILMILYLVISAMIS